MTQKDQTMKTSTSAIKHDLSLLNVSYLLLALFLILALSGKAFANSYQKNTDVSGLYVGTGGPGNEPITIRLSKDGQFDIISATELQKETTGIGLWKILYVHNNKVKIKGAYQQYMVEPAFGCNIDPPTSTIINWGCVFKIAVDATITHKGHMSGILTISISNGQTPDVTNLTIEDYPISADRVPLDQLYNRAKNVSP